MISAFAPLCPGLSPVLEHNSPEPLNEISSSESVLSCRLSRLLLAAGGRGADGSPDSRAGIVHPCGFVPACAAVRRRPLIFPLRTRLAGRPPPLPVKSVRRGSGTVHPCPLACAFFGRVPSRLPESPEHTEGRPHGARAGYKDGQTARRSLGSPSCPPCPPVRLGRSHAPRRAQRESGTDGRTHGRRVDAAGTRRRSAVSPEAFRPSYFAATPLTRGTDARPNTGGGCLSLSGGLIGCILMNFRAPNVSGACVVTCEAVRPRKPLKYRKISSFGNLWGGQAPQAGRVQAFAAPPSSGFMVCGNIMSESLKYLNGRNVSSASVNVSQRSGC